jgi:transcriptional regulator with XRE-family HTH domain
VVALEIEFRRQQLGLSQLQLASRIGRSQGQLANALRGHDPISSAAVNRLREILINKGGYHVTNTETDLSRAST